MGCVIYFDFFYSYNEYISQITCKKMETQLIIQFSNNNFLKK